MQSGYRKDVRNPAVAETFHRAVVHIPRIAREHGVRDGGNVFVGVVKYEFPDRRIYAAEERKAVLALHRRGVTPVAHVLYEPCGADVAVGKRRIAGY